MSQAARPSSSRQSQQRSEVMRSRLLDATLDVILEKGWAQASTPAICRHAGISRGAQTHHFPAKKDLLLAAIKQSAHGYGDLIHSRTSTLDPDETPLRAYLEVLWDACLDDRSLQSWMEVLVAARTDADLRSSVTLLDTSLLEALRNVAETLTDCTESETQAKDLIELTVYVLRGMVVQRGVNEDESSRRRLFELWCEVVMGALEKQQLD